MAVRRSAPEVFLVNLQASTRNFNGNLKCNWVFFPEICKAFLEMSVMKSLKESVFCCKLWRSLFLVKLQVLNVNCCFGEWEPWYELKRNLQSFTKYLRLILVFISNSALLEKFKEFLKSVLLVLTKFSFWQGDWAIGYHSMKFRHFSDIS